MAYTRINKTRFGKAAIDYVLNSKSHKKGMARALVARGLNCDTRFVKEEMEQVWKAYGKENGYVQAYRVIQSFHPDELNPDNEDDIQKANEVGYKLAEELFPDRQVLIVTQADGVGGKLHNHLIVNSVSFLDGKSLRGNRKEHKAVREASDKILQQEGISLPDNTPKAKIKRTVTELRKAQKGEYVWKDDLRSRIDEVLNDSSTVNREIFLEKLVERGVDCVWKEERKDITFKFLDEEGKERKARGKRSLGDDYTKESLVNRFLENAQKDNVQGSQEKVSDVVPNVQTIEHETNKTGEVSGVNLDNWLANLDNWFENELNKIYSRRSKPKRKEKVSDVVPNVQTIEHETNKTSEMSDSDLDDWLEIEMELEGTDEMSDSDLDNLLEIEMELEESLLSPEEVIDSNEFMISEIHSDMNKKIQENEKINTEINNLKRESLEVSILVQEEKEENRRALKDSYSKGAMIGDAIFEGILKGDGSGSDSSPPPMKNVNAKRLEGLQNKINDLKEQRQKGLVDIDEYNRQMSRLMRENEAEQEKIDRDTRLQEKQMKEYQEKQRLELEKERRKKKPIPESDLDESDEVSEKESSPQIVSREEKVREAIEFARNMLMKCNIKEAQDAPDELLLRYFERQRDVMKDYKKGKVEKYMTSPHVVFKSVQIAYANEQRYGANKVQQVQQENSYDGPEL